jgi:hypothetical protein
MTATGLRRSRPTEPYLSQSVAQIARSDIDNNEPELRLETLLDDLLQRDQPLPRRLVEELRSRPDKILDLSARSRSDSTASQRSRATRRSFAFRSVPYVLVSCGCVHQDNHPHRSRRADNGRTAAAHSADSISPNTRAICRRASGYIVRKSICRPSPGRTWVNRVA